MAKAFPKVLMEPDAIYVRDGNIWTSAGITAGMDLAIALIEHDIGREAALHIARRHVLYMMRPGGQSQFSAELSAQQAQGRTAKAVRHIAANLARDLSVPALAAASGLSQRTLLRAFREELNTTPAEFVQRARVDAARRRLAAPRAPVERVAAACGFASAETMRRAFQKSIGVAPAEYRARFATAQRASP
jgi:transcriptional regulator GlxA family with amidase domain